MVHDDQACAEYRAGQLGEQRGQLSLLAYSYAGHNAGTP